MGSYLPFCGEPKGPNLLADVAEISPAREIGEVCFVNRASVPVVILLTDGVHILDPRKLYYERYWDSGQIIPRIMNLETGSSRRCWSGLKCDGCVLKMTPDEVTIATNLALSALGYGNVRSEARIEGEAGCTRERLITLFFDREGLTKMPTNDYEDVGVTKKDY